MQLLPLSVWILSTLLLCASGFAGNGSKPNVVFVLADDLGIGDVGCYGGERCKIETPNIDQLAAEGIRFTDAHVNASVCQPTRIAIMTGRYPWRFDRAAPGGAWGYVGLSMPDTTYTLGDMFRQAGYSTGYIGKWHLGTAMATTDNAPQNIRNVDYAKPLRCGAPEFGFDYSFILPGSLDMYPYAFIENNVWQGDVTATKGWSAFNRLGPAAQDFQDHEVLETFYKTTEQFLEKQQASKPFFLYLALTAPHTPTSPGIDWQGKSSLGVYGDFVMEVDHAVERVRTKLNELGLDKNTVIVFSSDHGPASYAGNILKATKGQMKALEAKGHHANGPYRGYKFSVYEGGLRVPLIVSGPESDFARGQECGALVGLCDLMATFASLAQIELSDTQGVDSVSFAECLTNPDAIGAREDLIMQSIGPFVVRHKEWKLCLCPGSGATGRYGNEPPSEEAWRAAVMLAGDLSNAKRLKEWPFVQLFNLEDDPGEEINLAKKYPDRVAEMYRLLQRQVEKGRSTAGPRQANDRTKVNVHQRVPDFVRRAQAAPRN